MGTNNVDFTFKSYKRSYIFLKKPMGSDIPEGWTWDCPCGRKNDLKRDTDQYCPSCGTRLRIQEHRPDESKPSLPNEQSFTVVRVSHFTIKQNGAPNGA